MAKRKTRAVQQSNGVEPDEEYRIRTLTSGVTVRVTAFPILLHKKIMRAVEAQFPLPDPPLKVVETVTGPEEVEDTTNEEYVAEVKRIKRQRSHELADRLGSSVCRRCVEVVGGLEQYRAELEGLEEDLGTLPSDPKKLKVEFLTGHAVKTLADYKVLIADSTALMAVSQEEVDQEIESFPDQLERTEAPEADSSGSTAG